MRASLWVPREDAHTALGCEQLEPSGLLMKSRSLIEFGNAHPRTF